MEKEEYEFVSKGRPLNHKIVYIVAFIAIMSLGIYTIIASEKSIFLIILGIVFILFSIFVLVYFISSLIILKDLVNLMIKDDKFYVSSIGEVDIEEIDVKDITSIDLFVLPILNGGFKDTMNYNYHVQINTKIDKYIVYCGNKKELEEYLTAKYKNLIEK